MLIVESDGLQIEMLMVVLLLVVVEIAKNYYLRDKFIYFAWIFRLCLRLCFEAFE